MAPFGIINTQLRVDQRKINGPHEKLTGTVVLTFARTRQPRTITAIANDPAPALDQELFGPLRLLVVLQGHAKLKVLENRTSHAYIHFRETRQLFHKTRVVFEGPFRARANEPQSFRFEITFPEYTDDYRGFWNSLPPTFYTRFQAQAARQAGKHQGAAWIEYGLQTQVEMPGIDVEVVRTSEVPIRYSQSFLPISLDLPPRQFEQQMIVQSYDLLPGTERPNNLLDRTKAVLKQVTKPLYVFDVTCLLLPEALHLGQAATFEVRVRPNDAATTATTCPDINLGICEVEILARTQLFATSLKGADSAKLDHTMVLTTLPATAIAPTHSHPERQDLTPAFSKATDFTKTLTTGPLPSEIIPTSFRIVKLERSYRMRVVLRFVVAGIIVCLRKDMPLTILPPLSAKPAAARAGPSSLRHQRRTLPDDDELEQLPAYEEARRPAYEERPSAPPSTGPTPAAAVLGA